SLDIGLGTSGTLNVNSGGDVTAALGTIGNTSTGAATVSGSGSTLTTTSHLDVGGGATRTFAVNTGGRNTTPTASIAGAPGSSGTATIDGSTSHWEQTGYFKVGEYGTATLNLQNGGYINNTATGLNPDSSIGDQSGSSGTVNINTNGHWSIQ